MDSLLNDQTYALATERLEQARKLLEQNFGSGSAIEKPEVILACAQLLAIEYNSLMVDEAARQPAAELKSFLLKDF